AKKPWEIALRWKRGSRLGEFCAWVVEEYHARIDVGRVVDAAEKFGRECRIDAIWATLQGQTLVRMALPLAQRLGVPLFTQVFDPLPWWLKAHSIDAWHARSVLAQFHRTLESSVACATASQSMADAYSARYGTRCVPLIASHSSALAAPLGRALTRPG